jgi:hypothetical protein
MTKFYLDVIGELHFKKDIPISKNEKWKIMDNRPVLWKKVLKQRYLLQFFRLHKMYTFCITGWLVDIDSKLKRTNNCL